MMYFAAHTHISSEAILMAAINVVRVSQWNPNLPIDQYTIHRLLITSLVLSAKFYDDQYNDNLEYAVVCGIELSLLNRMEVLFFFTLAKCNVFVDHNIYNNYYHLFLTKNPLLKQLVVPTSIQELTDDVVIMNGEVRKLCDGVYVELPGVPTARRLRRRAVPDVKNQCQYHSIKIKDSPHPEVAITTRSNFDQLLADAISNQLPGLSSTPSPNIQVEVDVRITIMK